MFRPIYVLIFVATLVGSAKLSEVTNIDMLTARYLTLEKALWKIIRDGNDRDFTIQRIHDIHLTFFSENFSENGMKLTLYDQDQKKLHSAISYINMTAAVINDMYLHANAEDFKREESIGFARTGANLTQQMDKIYNVTENNGFFQYIATVSCFCFSTFIFTTFLFYDIFIFRHSCLTKFCISIFFPWHFYVIPDTLNQ